MDCLINSSKAKEPHLFTSMKEIYSVPLKRVLTLDYNGNLKFSSGKCESYNTLPSNGQIASPLFSENGCRA